MQLIDLYTHNSWKNSIFSGFFKHTQEGFLTVTPAQESKLTALVHVVHVFDVLTQPTVNKPPLSDISKLCGS